MTSQSKSAERMNQSDVWAASQSDMRRRLVEIADSSDCADQREADRIRRELARRVGCCVGP